MISRFFTGIAITALLLTQSCSSTVRFPKGSLRESLNVSSEESPHKAEDRGRHRGHSTSETTDSGHNGHESDPHAGHNRDRTQTTDETTQAKLVVSGAITPNKSVPLAIVIEDAQGKAIANFDKFQTKLMHAIVVSDDLEFFTHLHPEYKGNGRFEIDATFPKSGNYTIFSDYKPAAKNEQVSVIKTKVVGTSKSVQRVDLNHSKTFEKTKVNLTTSEPTLKANQKVTLRFDLRDATTDRPLKDLQPYLGEKGHLVILRQSPSLTSADYIHAHAMPDTAPNLVHFITQFPQPGKYKIWGQFNRNGKIITADFWVNVL